MVRASVAGVLDTVRVPPGIWALTDDTLQEVMDAAMKGSQRQALLPQPGLLQGACAFHGTRLAAGCRGGHKWSTSLPQLPYALSPLQAPRARHPAHVAPHLRLRAHLLSRPKHLCRRLPARRHLARPDASPCDHVRGACGPTLLRTAVRVPRLGLIAHDVGVPQNYRHAGHLPIDRFPDLADRLKQAGNRPFTITKEMAQEVASALEAQEGVLSRPPPVIPDAFRRV